MLQNQEEITYNTADCAKANSATQYSVGDGESQGDPKQSMQRHQVTDHSRVAFHCQALEMPHLECCVGSKLLSRWTNWEKLKQQQVRGGGCTGKQNTTQLSKLTVKEHTTTICKYPKGANTKKGEVNHSAGPQDYS